MAKDKISTGVEGGEIWDSKDGRGPASTRPLVKGRHVPSISLCSIDKSQFLEDTPEEGGDIPSEKSTYELGLRQR